MELPLYQWLTAQWTHVTGMALEQSGRMFSLIFFYIGLAIFLWLAKRLRLPPGAALLFAVLYLTSPLYLYWSRAFLIETTAMAFSLAYFATATAGLHETRRPLFLAAGLFGCLAALIKSTTFAGAFAGVFLLGAAAIWKGSLKRRDVTPFVAVVLLCPVGVGLWWVRFSDAVKLQNPLQHLTSQDLRLFQFGDPAFRFTRPFWSVLFHQRIPDLLGEFWLPITVAVLATALPQWRKIPVAAWAGLAAYWAPTLVFAPLHFIHNYYASGTAAYLYAGLAIMGGALWPAARWKQWLCAATIAVLAAGNLLQYRRAYWPDVFPASDPYQDTARFLKANTKPQDVIMIYGHSWNTVIPYFSQRRAIMDNVYRPLGSPEMRDAIAGLGLNQRIAAVVACLKAREGWFAVQVAANVAQLGFSEASQYENRACRVFLAPPGAPVQPLLADEGTGPANAKAYSSKIAESSLRTPNDGLDSNLKLGGVDIELLAASPFPIAYMDGSPARAGILADPDTRLAVPVPPSASGVRIGFAIGDYAWKTRHTPAVDFSVSYVRGGETQRIWSRSLDPAIRTRDRGTQSVVVPFPRGTTELILATSSPQRISAHRAYWTAIRFQSDR